jgi:MFS family permease
MNPENSKMEHLGAQSADLQTNMSIYNYRGVKVSAIVSWMILVVGTTFVIFKFFNQSSYSVVSFGVSREFDLSLEEVGWLGSIYTLAYAFVTFFCGGLFDRYGGWRILSIGVVFIIAGASIFATAQSWPALLIGQGLMGVGGSFGFPGLAYLVREHFGPLRFGIVFGVAQTFAAFAGAALQQLVGLLIQAYSWRELLLMQAGVGIPILLAIFLAVRPAQSKVLSVDMPKEDMLVPSILRSVRLALASRTVLVAALISGVTFAAISCLGVIWGVRLLEARGFEQTEANSISAMVWMGIGGGAPSIALLARALKSHIHSALLFSAGALLSIGLIAFVAHGTTTQYVTLFFLYGFFGGGAAMSGYSIVAEAADESMVGSAFAIVTFSGFALGGLMMPIPAYLIGHRLVDGIEQAILVYPITLLLMISAMLVLRRKLPA